MRLATLALLALLALACSTPPEEPMAPHTPQTSELAEGVHWSSTVTLMRTGSNTDFTFVVKRTNGTLVADMTFDGTVTVPAGQTTTLSFPLDADSGVEGYRLTLHGDATFSGVTMAVGPTSGR